MTLYTAFRSSKRWQAQVQEDAPPYRQVVFTQGAVPLAGWIATPPNPQGTIIGTYGITGTLDNQWYLHILGRKAYAQNYAVVLFDWRAHGASAPLSSVLTSDGLNEGQDFVHLAAESKTLGCPAPFWFTGYSLGGQLALWGVHYAQFLEVDGISPAEIGGGAVICPNLDSNLSLPYLMKHPLGKYIEQRIARELKKLALQLHSYHPEEIELTAIEKAHTIWGFDHELVIPRLGFDSVEDYFTACSPFNILPKINKPTLMLYAADDPMFSPEVIPKLVTTCKENSSLELILTQAGGHVGYLSSQHCQQQAGDHDPWWAWNRILDWLPMHQVSI